MIFYMYENHTFKRLDTMSVSEAVGFITAECTARPTYGFIGCKGCQGGRVYQWGPEDDWLPTVTEILEAGV